MMTATCIPLTQKHMNDSNAQAHYPLFFLSKNVFIFITSHKRCHASARSVSMFL